MQTLKFSEIGEFGFIESIKKECTISWDQAIKGIGDDCAVFGPYSGRLFLATTDMLVEDIHFLRNAITFYQLGKKAVAVNLSDIAAMGGRPLALLISLGIPANTSVESMQDLYKGMKEMCTHYHVTIIGGDTVASPDKLIINISLIGDVKEDEVLYRSGAGPGDKVYLTGNVGDSYAGLKIIKGEVSPPQSITSHFIKTHNEPKPMIEVGGMIAGSRLASAMIDISDGLLSDLGHICKESAVGAVLFKDSIPLSHELTNLCSLVNFNPLDFALSGGEDYLLLVTVPKGNARGFEQLWNGEVPCPLHLIGEIRQGKGLKLMNEDGSVDEIGLRGFDHFSPVP